MNWISKLAARDTVYVREPWTDKMHPGGVLWKTRVKAKLKSGRVIVSGQDGTFHPETGRSGPYAHLEKPTIELLEEYIEQQKTELENQAAWESTHPMDDS